LFRLVDKVLGVGNCGGHLV